MSEQDTSQRALEGSDSINVGNLSELDFEIELGIIARELAPTWNDSLQAARNATISTADLKESGRATVEQIQEAQQMEVESYQTEEGHRISLWKAMERLDATAACPAARDPPDWIGRYRGPSVTASQASASPNRGNSEMDAGYTTRLSTAPENPKDLKGDENPADAKS